MKNKFPFRSTSLAVLTFCCFNSHLTHAYDIPLVGLDDTGNPIEAMIPAGKYQQALHQMLTSVQETTSPALERFQTKSRWSLQTVVVGAGVNFTVGLPGVIEWSTVPRFRMAFSQSSDLVLP